MRLIPVLFLLVACSTSTQFHGAAKVPGGPDGCRARCAAWHMELAGMVALGDYSNGCICRVPGEPAASAVAAAGPAAAGVVMQMEAQQHGGPMKPQPIAAPTR